MLVYIRCKLDDTDESHNCVQCIPARNKIAIVTRHSTIRHFHFDRILSPFAQQSEMFRAVENAVLGALAGRQSTVFAYGLTGTGKTFTIEGEVCYPLTPNSGIMPRSLALLYFHQNDRERIASFYKLKSKNPFDGSFKIYFSYLEIYNEELFDLFASEDKKIRINRDRAENLTEISASDIGEALSLVGPAVVKRRKAVTQLNKTSSRSHCIFSIRLVFSSAASKLNLVDLAGNEDLQKSKVERLNHKETGKINTSLLALGRVITALAKQSKHIPYRDSKLTRLLRESLNETTNTVMIVTISTSSVNLEETVNTLEYARRAMIIKTNQPVCLDNFRLSDWKKQIRKLKRELSEQRDMLGKPVNTDYFLQIENQIKVYENMELAIEEEKEKRNRSLMELLEKHETEKMAAEDWHGRLHQANSEFQIQKRKRAEMEKLEKTKFCLYEEKKNCLKQAQSEIDQKRKETCNTRESLLTKKSTFEKQRKQLEGILKRIEQELVYDSSAEEKINQNFFASRKFVDDKKCREEALTRVSEIIQNLKDENKNFLENFEKSKKLLRILKDEKFGLSKVKEFRNLVDLSSDEICESFQIFESRVSEMETRANSVLTQVAHFERDIYQNLKNPVNESLEKVDEKVKETFDTIRFPRRCRMKTSDWLAGRQALLLQQFEFSDSKKKFYHLKNEVKAELKLAKIFPKFEVFAETTNSIEAFNSIARDFEDSII